MSRGRKPIEINREELQMAIRALENQNSFPNRTALWEALEATDWAKAQSPRPLTRQVAMIKAEQLGLEIKTPKGRRGREKGCGPIVGGRKKRKMSEEAANTLINGIPLEHRPRLMKTAQRAINGSRKAADKLKCEDCCNYQPSEIRLCELMSCSLWSFRPNYKKSETVVKELL